MADLTDAQLTEWLAVAETMPPTKEVRQLDYGDFCELIRMALAEQVPAEPVSDERVSLHAAVVQTAIGIVKRHRRHIELSPGAGADCQNYGISTCDDILAELAMLAAQESK